MHGMGLKEKGKDRNKEDFPSSQFIISLVILSAWTDGTQIELGEEGVQSTEGCLRKVTSDV